MDEKNKVAIKIYEKCIEKNIKTFKTEEGKEALMLIAANYGVNSFREAKDMFYTAKYNLTESKTTTKNKQESKKISTKKDTLNNDSSWRIRLAKAIVEKNILPSAGEKERLINNNISFNIINTIRKEKEIMFKLLLKNNTKFILSIVKFDIEFFDKNNDLVDISQKGLYDIAPYSKEEQTLTVCLIDSRATSYSMCISDVIFKYKI